MPLFLSHVAVKIRGLCSVYIVYGAKTHMFWSDFKDVSHQKFQRKTKTKIITKNVLKMATENLNTGYLQ